MQTLQGVKYPISRSQKPDSAVDSTYLRYIEWRVGLSSDVGCGPRDSIRLSFYHRVNHSTRSPSPYFLAPSNDIIYNANT